MANEFTLDQRDRDKFGGPEWVAFDVAELDEIPFDQLNKWELEMGVSISQVVTGELPKASALGIKGVVWLARQMAGHTDPKFADFNIRTRLVRYRPVSGDARPPAQGSSEPSPEGAA